MKMASSKVPVIKLEGDDDDDCIIVDPPQSSPIIEGQHSSTQPLSPPSPPSPLPSATSRSDNLFELTSEQAAKTKFPVGCQVLYNFQSSSSYASSHVTDVCEGVVKSVSLNTDKKRFEFQIERKASKKHDGSGDETILDAAIEDGIAYAIDCPVLITTSCNGTAADPAKGKVLFVKPVNDENGNLSMRYIVQYATSETGILRMEEGVIADRISYQKPADGSATNKDHGEGKVRGEAPLIPPVLVPNVSSNTSEGCSRNDDQALIESEQLEKTRTDGKEGSFAVGSDCAKGQYEKQQFSSNEAEAVVKVSTSKDLHANEGYLAPSTVPQSTANEKNHFLANKEPGEIPERNDILDSGRNPKFPSHHQSNVDVQKPEGKTDLGKDSNKASPSNVVVQKPSHKTDSTTDSAKDTNIITQKPTSSVSIPQQDDSDAISPLTYELSDPGLLDRPTQHKKINFQPPSKKRTAASAADHNQLLYKKSGEHLFERPKKISKADKLGQNARKSRSRAKKAGDGLTCHMTVPLWVDGKKSLLHHILGVKDAGVLGHKTKQIYAQTGCKISLTRHNPKRGEPMTIIIRADKKCSNSDQDFHEGTGKALQMVENSIFQYLSERAANPRLRFEMRAGSHGTFLPPRAESGAVQLNENHWGQLLELSCVKTGSIVPSDNNRRAQLSHDLRWRIIQETSVCSVELFNDSPDTPLRKCKPYVFIQGRELKEVDRATAIITNTCHTVQNQRPAVKIAAPKDTLGSFDSNEWAL